ncbi:glutamyl-tRNA amidotransferase subunit C [Metamycoplasma arthritidis]|uniref:Glutamyl-tRNA amidotransferase subunit C n=1 Tax=Metamycoplasma arthritidis (strain 158L3-1) TaxID=243272 RepID=B3PLS8_META1|nr:Asp-tRNA(Asn)/Glu-tRNA(Gln) amidotransferase subunit GatC [Metamycoplasma arthritidis]ACF06980.1 glutamyl-tRNA amidotransferase subunit C [Metamycoplasma arthritidis 158L3-1]VEU78509.1 glutamyl-tRNA amidotransferase subunit C [Metamycoplasma arthritidis]
MTEEKIKKLANDIYLNPSEEVIALTKKLLASIDFQLKELDKFDLATTKPLSRLTKNPLSFQSLREDEVVEFAYLTKEKMLQNSPSNNGDFVTIKKVVND